jgi:TetR/AcrR family transcriptional regulator, transcriptional repressor for nem operon
VAGTSTEDVRVAAGVSSSQLYHYFDGKYALVRAVIGYQTDAVLSAQGPLLSRLDSIAALQAWRDLVVDLQARGGCEGGCPLGSLAAQLAEIDSVARTDLVAGLRGGRGRSGTASSRCASVVSCVPKPIPIGSR